MNKIIKMLIKESIHNNILTHVKNQTGDKYIIFDRDGREILSVDNGWAIIHYSVCVNHYKCSVRGVAEEQEKVIFLGKLYLKD